MYMRILLLSSDKSLFDLGTLSGKRPGAYDKQSIIITDNNTKAKWSHTELFDCFLTDIHKQYQFQFHLEGSTPMKHG